MPYDIIKTEHGASVRTPDGDLELRHVIGIGRNYAAHAAERGADVPDRPMTFCKNPASLTTHGTAIVIPACCRDPETGGEDRGEPSAFGQVDYEAELAVIIGGPTKDVTEDEALGRVLGYCCANDVSARWWQKHGSGGQFNRGKSFDTFCPLGPRVVEPDAAPDPQRLRVVCRLNGRTMQDGSTADMIFPVAALIAELSRGTTLLPGTVILTGTPSGVGAGRTPPVFLQAGDEVEVEIDGPGVLCNTVSDG